MRIQQIWSKDMPVNYNIYGYVMMYHIGNGIFEIYEIKDSHVWDQMNGRFGHLDKKKRYLEWVIPCNCGKIDMKKWNLLIPSIFSNTGFNTSEFANKLETVFTWKVPEIKFFDYATK